MIPRLMPCSSSPPPGATSSRNRSTMSATATSDWPTPIVSTITTSKPNASHSSMASRVRRATPPSWVPPGEGRMNASGWRDSSAMRVLSPRIEPPVRELDGSTASTAARWPRPTRCRPNASMNVDLPTPGEPLMPMRTEPPVDGSTASSTPAASARWSARVDSTSVMARASGRRSPDRMPSISSAESSGTQSGRAATVEHEGEHLAGRLGDVRARAEDGRRTGGVERVVVLGRDDPAHDHQHVVGAGGLQLLDQLRDEREVAGGLAGHADHVHVVLDGVTGRLGRRLEERSDVYVEAEVGERGGDHLRPAIVAVLAHLHDEHA